MKRYSKPNIMDKFQIDVHDELYQFLDDKIASEFEDNLALQAHAAVPQYAIEYAPEEYEPGARYEVDLNAARDKYIEALIRSLYGKLYR